MQTSSSNDAATLPGSSSATGNSYSTAAGQAMARLQPVTTATGFSFPPIYSFPPFFTQASLFFFSGRTHAQWMKTCRKQRNTKTANAQLSQWTSLILDYCRHHRMYKVDLGANTTGHELWCNADISSMLYLPRGCPETTNRTMLRRTGRQLLSSRHHGPFSLKWSVTVSSGAARYPNCQERNRSGHV